MSYHDPYSEHHWQGASGQHNYNDSVTDFNPYATNAHEHNTYRDTPNYPNYPFDNTMGYPPKQQEKGFQPAQGLEVEPNRRGNNGFEQGEFTPQEKSVQGLKRYRYNYRGNLWSKGGRGRCIGRFCCCILISAVFLIVSIILTLALWIRPPNVTIGEVSLAQSDAVQIEPTQKTLTINFGVNISASNPNYFAVAFRKIKADIIYPINNTHVGGGELDNIVFKSDQQTNITFPFAIKYNAAADPGYKVLLDLSQKCGVTGAQSQIAVNYKITLGLRILFFVVSPVISNSMSFKCPATAQQIKDFLKSVGIENP